MHNTGHNLLHPNSESQLTVRKKKMLAFLQPWGILKQSDEGVDIHFQMEVV